MFSLAPSSLLGYALLLLRSHVDRARDADDRGASAIEWVVITAMLVVIAGAVFAVLYNLIVNKANDIDLETPAAP
ncbi:MAG: hypothetical protein ACKVZ6_23175 [Kineosporiaceae bacterium]|jgi:hypothetical protein